MANTNWLTVRYLELEKKKRSDEDNQDGILDSILQQVSAIYLDQTTAPPVLVEV